MDRCVVYNTSKHSDVSELFPMQTMLHSPLFVNLYRAVGLAETVRQVGHLPYHILGHPSSILGKYKVWQQCIAREPDPPHT